MCSPSGSIARLGADEPSKGSRVAGLAANGPARLSQLPLHRSEIPLHEELSQDPESPWYVGTPDQTQVLHDELWISAGELYPRSSAALVDGWYRTGRSSLLPVNCTGELFSSQHLQLVG
jgi:hypothetical protein